jgi:hypothetical protein
MSKGFGGRRFLKVVDEALDAEYRVNVVFVGSGMSIEQYRLLVQVERSKVLAHLVGEILLNLANGVGDEVKHEIVVVESEKESPQDTGTAENTGSWWKHTD